MCWLLTCSAQGCCGGRPLPPLAHSAPAAGDTGPHLVILVPYVVSHEVLLHEELLDDGVVQRGHGLVVLVQEVLLRLRHRGRRERCTGGACQDGAAPWRWAWVTESDLLRPERAQGGCARATPGRQAPRRLRGHDGCGSARVGGVGMAGRKEPRPRYKATPRLRRPVAAARGLAGRSHAAKASATAGACGVHPQGSQATTERTAGDERATTCGRSCPRRCPAASAERSIRRSSPATCCCIGPAGARGALGGAQAASHLGTPDSRRRLADVRAAAR